MATQNKKKSVAIIGAGPAGCISAYYADKDLDVTLFDFSRPLHTLLYTGGGRCNLAYAEYDFRELAKFYPRGEKFLYSLFSRFATGDTTEFFQNIGVDTYIQDDLRIFPTSNSAQDVREKVLHSIENCTFKQEKVLKIVKHDDEFLITTDYNSYHFDKVVVAVGGHAGFSLAKDMGHNIVEPKQALVALVTQKNFKALQGVCVKGASAEVYFQNKKITQLTDDILFTHNGISGPLTYKISSVCARLGYNIQNPLKIKLAFVRHAEFISASNQLANTGKILKQVQDDAECEDTLKCFQDLLNSNPKKDIKNLISDFVPKSLADFLLGQNQIALDEKCCNINGKKRDSIIKALTEFEIVVNAPTKDGEVVTAGGVSLDEINPKTMASKLVQNLYFCGEVIDVDGFCGGFNLQNCWSTGFVAGSSI
jgi:predicted flavoprotein YhiN